MRGASLLAVMLILLAGCAKAPAEAFDETPVAADASPIGGHDPEARTLDGNRSWLLQLPAGDHVGAIQLDLPADAAVLEPPFAPVTHWYVRPVGDAMPSRAMAVFLLDDRVIHSMGWGERSAWVWHDTVERIDVPVEPFGQQFWQMTGSLPHVQVIFASQGAKAPVSLAISLGDVPDDDGTAFDAYQKGTNATMLPSVPSTMAYHEYVERFSVLPTTSAGGVTVYGDDSVGHTVGAPIVEDLDVGMTQRGGARSITIEASCDLGGWSHARLQQTSLVEDSYLWDIWVAASSAGARDNGWHSSVVLADAIATEIVFGYMRGAASGDGGGATAHLEWHGQSAPLQHDTRLVSLCLSAPIGAVLDMTGEPSAAVDDGLLPGVLP